MTTSVMHRCEHCNDVYIYHPSYYGMMPRYNHSQFCSTCAEVLEKSFEKVPTKFVKKFVETKDYTREQIVAAQEERCKKEVEKASNSKDLIIFPGMRRVMPGLFDLRDPSNKETRVVERMKDPVSGEKMYYSVAWWSKEPDEIEISKEVWWDIENNKVADDQRSYRA